MKFAPLYIILFSSFLFFSCAEKKENSNFSFLPEKPKAGETVSIHFNKTTSPLAKSEKVFMFASFYTKDLDSTVRVPMENAGKGVAAKFKIDEGINGVLIKFSDEKEKLIDDNNRDGYLVKIYDTSGDILPENIAGRAAAYADWGRFVGFRPDQALAFDLFTEAFDLDPELKKSYFDQYFTSLLYEDNGKGKIVDELKQIESAEDKKYDDFVILANWYQKAGDSLKAAEFNQYILDNFAESDYSLQKKLDQINSLENTDEKITKLIEFVDAWPEFENGPKAFNGIARDLRDRGEYTWAAKILLGNEGHIHPHYYFTTANKMVDDNKELKLAEKIAGAGVIAAEKRRDKSPSERRTTMTAEEFQMENDYYYGMSNYALGNALLKRGKKEKAVPLLEKAVMLTDKDSEDVINSYVSALYDTKQYSEVMKFVENCIADCKPSENIRSFLKKAYVKKNGNENGFLDYLEGLENSAFKELKEELSHQMLNIKAPGFTLTDLEGKKVSLDDFKGKVVIIDFWATWCPPCRASFPGMQKAVNKYSDDEDVKFLFLNTRDGGLANKENARSFIESNKYSFHVLIDEGDEVIRQYNVPGIPTKFIVDQHGQIRFRSVGYSGTPDGLVMELSAMISLLRQAG